MIDTNAMDIRTINGKNFFMATHTEKVDRFTVITFEVTVPTYPPSKEPVVSETKFWVDAENERVMWCHPPARWDEVGKTTNACGDSTPHCEAVFGIPPHVFHYSMDHVAKAFISGRPVVSDGYVRKECLYCIACARHGWMYDRDAICIDR